MQKYQIACDVCMRRMREPTFETSFRFERPADCRGIDENTIVTVTFQDFSKDVCAKCLARACQTWANEFLMTNKLAGEAENAKSDKPYGGVGRRTRPYLPRGKGRQEG